MVARKETEDDASYQDVPRIHSQTQVNPAANELSPSSERSIPNGQPVPIDTTASTNAISQRDEMVHAQIDLQSTPKKKKKVKVTE